MNVLNVPELFGLKCLILRYGNFTSMKKNKKTQASCPCDHDTVVGTSGKNSATLLPTGGARADTPRVAGAAATQAAGCLDKVRLLRAEESR